MLLFAYSPSPDSAVFQGLYERMAQEGMVHSAPMGGEHFDMAGEFDERWAAPSITWSCGGRETYVFGKKRSLAIEPAGVLTLAAGERYAYDADGAAPFRSNMISFPHWITKKGDKDELDALLSVHDQLQTRLCAPRPKTFALMTKIARRCILGAQDDAWYGEQMALLYGRLLQEQSFIRIGSAVATKTSTREELARRIERSIQFMLARYAEPTLAINDAAGAACLSPFHYIRVFKDAKGQTPMQFLGEIRMEAAMRQLQDTARSVETIAASVGYRDRPAFMRAFKRRYGATPSTFRA